MLKVSDLSVRYGMHEALASVSLQIDHDEIVVILGANGAGKSTLLSAIAGNCVGEVDGVVTHNGDQLSGMGSAEVVANGIAFVPEGRGVFSDLTVEENLQLGSYAEHARNNERDNLARVLSLFPKLKERKKQTVRTMSGGEQQMVAIGRALMSAPSILMLDEPSLGLSPLLCKELFASLKQVRDSGVGVLLVEQNAKQSLGIADRGYLLGNGKIIGQESARNLLDDPKVQAAYLGGGMAKQPPPVEARIETANATESHAALESVKETGLSITPRSDHTSAETKASDSLLNEDIEALVARASQTASHRQETSFGTSVNTVNLAGSEDHGAQKVLAPAASGKPVELPETQDSKVQALLADFERAARKAAGGSDTDPADLQSGKSANATAVTNDSSRLPLPHIPVYKKSSVTVYKRDGSGKLQKSDRGSTSSWEDS